MDAKDRSLLSQLVLNSRTPANQLAKPMRASREVAHYRLQRLLKGIVVRTYAVINHEALGYQRYGLLLQLQNTTPQQAEVIYRRLEEHPLLTDCSPLIGKYDYACDALVHNDEQLREVIRDIKACAGAHFKRCTLTGASGMQHFFTTKLFAHPKPVVQERRTERGESIDETDGTILRMLSENARCELTQIAKETGLTATGVAYRIRQLTERQVILGFTTHIDYRALGFTLYNVQLQIANNAPISRIKAYLQDHPRVLYFYEQLGNQNWDIDVGYFVTGTDMLGACLQELKEQFGTVVELHELFIVREITKIGTPAGLLRTNKRQK